MSSAVASLLDEALLLPAESRLELVEALLERTEPSEEHLAAQLSLETRRRAAVQNGTSSLIPAEQIFQTGFRPFPKRGGVVTDDLINRLREADGES